MKANRNDGTWKDPQLYPFVVDNDFIGHPDYKVFYITGFMQCSCGLINCEHVQLVRDFCVSEYNARKEAGESFADFYADEIDETYAGFLAGTGRT